MKNNILTNVDSYKTGMWLQYPKNTQFVYSYIESRGAETDELVLFGIRYFLKEYLSKPVTAKGIKRAKKLAESRGEPFNEAGWNHILTKHKGKLPIIIRALPEGSIVNGRVVMAVIYNTDPVCYWLTTHIETSLLRAVWYPTTVATNSREIKKIIKENLEQTGDVAGLMFKLHDFGARGAQVFESSGIGGAAHLINFFGTDTLAGCEFAIDYYNAEYNVGVSIPATEHSISTSFGPEKEAEYLRNHIEKCLERNILMFSAVADTYNIYKFVDMLGTTMKDEIIALGGVGATLVVRPDSGDATVVPVEIIEKLMEYFGYTVNEKGYKVLPPFLRVIQGDGIEAETIRAIYANMIAKKLSGDNIAFGMGGKLLGAPQRDDYKFAMKASDVTINTIRYAVAKDPITDKGKKSKKGRFKVYKNDDGKFITMSSELTPEIPKHDYLEVVFENGNIMRKDTFDEIRERAKL